ncbi:MAG: DNA repair protein RecO [Gammaproteobacteria bacterium HGW-Gammaproteobacteria-4]|jgi:DNA repair protein RecO (recombination protein O)|nr:MAG: DNA repair protein RecO [Gammaproteobacteria bacterium HGW-Gammaproteobacteria-4]
MRVSAQPAWVLHVRPWRETSVLVELFTPDHGRIGALSRSVRGPKRQWLRAVLQPFTPLRVDFQQRGELANLGAVEPTAAPLALAGDAVLAGFYVNEILLRLTPRNDPPRALFGRYCALLGALASGESLAWTLRSFERDLLIQLGYALPFEHDAHGEAIDPDARYRIDAEQGAVRALAFDRSAITGAQWLALAGDDLPDAATLRVLRRVLRHQLERLLDGRPLRSWDMLGEMVRK